MPTNYLTTDTDLTSVANAIRTKGGTSAQLAFPADFVSAINAISGGGGVLTTVDFVVDNIKRSNLSISMDTTEYDNYMAVYAVAETGVYSDGVLTMDATPTIPASKNICMCGIVANPSSVASFTGKWGTTSVSNRNVRRGTEEIRASVSSYVAGNINMKSSGNTLIVASAQNNTFGSVGYYFKYRVYIYRWNNDTTETHATITYA